MPTLPLTLTFTFSDDYSPPDALRALDGTELAWIESHCDDGQALLISEYQDKPRLKAMLCALLAGVQDLDDAAWQVLTERWLDTSVGVQLDVIGAIVDLKRKGWGDEVYRPLLGAQILVLISKGDWPGIVDIMTALGIDVSISSISEPGKAEMRIILGAPFEAGAITAADAFTMIKRAKPGGVRLVFEFPAVDIADTFAWSDTTSTVTDYARGWGADDSSTGGRWADDLATTETV
jgi:hypothetical protein